MRRNKHNSRLTLLISAGAILVVSLIGVLLVRLSTKPGDISSSGWENKEAIMDENCADGPLDGFRADNQEVAYGSLRYRFNQEPWFADSHAAGTVCFQSEAGNKHFVKISYLLEDGSAAYQSQMIPPGSHIQTAKLSKSLEAGEYDAICRIELFDMDTLESIGALEEEIVLTIEK